MIKLFDLFIKNKKKTELTGRSLFLETKDLHIFEVMIKVNLYYR